MSRLAISLYAIALFSSSTLALAQTTVDSVEWENYTIDQHVSLEIPVQYVISDTLGAHVLKAQLHGGSIAVIVREYAGDNTSHIDNHDDLQQFYSGTVEGMVNAWRGSELSTKTLDIDGLLTQEFNFHIYGNNEKYLCQGWMFLANKKIYIVQTSHAVLMTEGFNAVKQRVFSSIQISEKITPKDQLAYGMSSNDKQSFAQGEQIGGIVRPIAIAVVVVAVILYAYLFFSARNGRITSWIMLAAQVFHRVRQVLVFILLAYGGLTLFAALTNWISDNGFPVALLMFLGSISLVVAFVVAKLKIPMTKPPTS